MDVRANWLRGFTPFGGGLPGGPSLLSDDDDDDEQHSTVLRGMHAMVGVRALRLRGFTPYGGSLPGCFATRPNIS